MHPGVPIRCDTRTVVRRRLDYFGGVLLLCLMFAALLAGSSTAAACPLLNGPRCGWPFHLNVAADARISPQALPRGKPVPIGVSADGEIRTSDGTQPSALREVVLSVDRDVEIDTRGLPVCGYRKLASRDSSGVRRACRRSIVGFGTARISVAAGSEASPVTVESEVTVLNAGRRDGTMRFFVHGTVPAQPRAVVARVEVRKRPGGDFGWQALVRLPRIANGLGSLVDISLRLKRFFFIRGERKSFLSARCPDGVFKLSLTKLLFRNEARVPGVGAQTVLKGGLAVPCRPRR